MTLKRKALSAAIYENYLWPGGITLVLAILGMFQRGRGRILSAIALAILVISYLLLNSGFSFG